MNKIVLVALLFAFIFVSCAKKLQEIEIKPASLSIKSGFENYLQIVDNTYKISKSSNRTGGGYYYSIGVNIKNISTKLITFESLDKTSLLILDKQGLPFAGIDSFRLDYMTNGDKFMNLVNNLGMTDFITFTAYAEKGSEVQKKGLPNPDTLNGFIIESRTRDRNAWTDKYWKSETDGSVIYFSKNGLYRNVTYCYNGQYTFSPNQLNFEDVIYTINSISPTELILNNGKEKFSIAKDADFVIGQWRGIGSGGSKKYYMGFHKDNSCYVSVDNQEMGDKQFRIIGSSLKFDEVEAKLELQKNKNQLWLDFDGNYVYLDRMYCGESELRNSIESILDSIKTNKRPVVSTSIKKDIDKLLTAYESCVDQSIKLFDRAKKGDVSAADKYLPVSMKADEIEGKLNSSWDYLSSGQLAKYFKLKTKMENIFIELNL